ncbi:MAG: phosphatidylserine decarboxylase family protein [Syntrophomonas sp.]|nr:phosphatidylserine decarboxylase family protein [Syntrophomonas sp.]
MSHSEPVAREGWPFILLFALVTWLLYVFVNDYAALLGLVLTLFSIFFFRNPERRIPGEQGSVVAPADGRVMDVVNVTETEYIQAEVVRVRIFLSLFNVHINRAPVNGRVEWVQKVPGRYLAAYRDEAGILNARNYVGLATQWGKVLVVQVTGLVARRLVCWVQPGDTLAGGQRFGLIRFGSCTELYLPAGTEILVAPGQKVRGGESLIARLDE